MTAQHALAELRELAPTDEAVLARIARLPESAATASRDYGRGYAQAVRDVLEVLEPTRAMLNPDCTPGTVYVDTDGDVVAECGCGWIRGGWPSKSEAKRAQKAHRFPGPNPKLATADAGPRTARRAATGQPPRRTPPSTPSRTSGT